jgi:3-oxoadipate enol-lactonase / 4-carboxymuconolactone decarboxylase
MTVAWRSDGPPDAPVLVLLNSIGTTTEMWTPCLAPLVEQFRVIRVDTRGHGASAASPPGTRCTIADLGADLVAVLDDLRVERVHVAGVSLGAMTAMWLAIHQPARVARLALLCTAAYLPTGASYLERAAAVRARGMPAVADVPGRVWVTSALAERDPTLVAGLQAMLAGVDAETYAQCCEALAGLDLRADLGRIAAPTLVACGSADTATPPALAEALVAAIPGARLERLDAAHLAPVEQPGAVAHLLLEHFGGGATLAAGYTTRRAVLGDEHVDRALSATTAFDSSFQQFLTRYAWGEVWSRPGLARRERSIATLAALVALGAENELALHVHAARRNGLEPAEIAEVLLHTALYAGLPRANRAFAIARDVLEGGTS